MLYQPVPPLVRRWLAALLALLIGLGPLATPAYAALTPLAEDLPVTTARPCPVVPELAPTLI